MCIRDSLYVGRGGYKLQKALDVTGWRLEGVTAMDIGASTGGFTDCMLQQGAVRVYAVDVGHDQLHEKLRTDSRVINLEGIDIRKTEKIQNFVAESSVLFCSVDVSFIPVEGIFASVLPFLADRARIVCLIKPQFEAGRQAVGKNGVVKDPKAHKQVLHALLAFFAGQRCRLEQLTYSPITGCLLYTSGSAGAECPTGYRRRRAGCRQAVGGRAREALLVHATVLRGRAGHAAGLYHQSLCFCRTDADRPGGSPPGRRRFQAGRCV